MKRSFRKRRWDRLAFAALLLMIVAILIRAQPTVDNNARWLPPGDYHVQRIVDERHLFLRSETDPTQHAPIRLLGIAVPEPWPEPLRTKAIQRLSRLAEHRPAQLRLDRRRLSRDGKLLGYVLVDGRLLNADLVEQGLAVSATRPEDCHAIARQINEAEAVAKASQRGIWSYSRRKS